MTRANTKAKDPSWQLQEAKSRLSQVVDHALREGPQTITLRGKPAVVVVSFVGGNFLLNFTSLRSRNLGQTDMAARPRFEDFTGCGLRNTEPDSALEGEE